MAGIKSYIQIRAPHNRLKIESAEQLWAEFLAYIEHSDANPLVEAQIFAGKGAEPQHGEVDRIRPYTLNGFCNTLGIHPGTWRQWKKRSESAATDGDAAEELFYDTMMTIESVFYDQQYQGAAIGIFQASIVQRALGLVDKKETKETGEKSVTLITSNMSDEEAAEAYALSVNPDQD